MIDGKHDLFNLDSIDVHSIQAEYDLTAEFAQRLIKFHDRVLFEVPIG